MGETENLDFHDFRILGPVGTLVGNHITVGTLISVPVGTLISEPTGHTKGCKRSYIGYDTL